MCHEKFVYFSLPYTFSQDTRKFIAQNITSILYIYRFRTTTFAFGPEVFMWAVRDININYKLYSAY